jgi:hypothetical protein
LSREVRLPAIVLCAVITNARSSAAPVIPMNVMYGLGGRTVATVRPVILSLMTA